MTPPYPSRMAGAILNFWLTKGETPGYLYCCVFWVVPPAQAAVELRIAIQKQASKVEIGSTTTAVIRDGSGKTLGEIAGMNSFTAQANRGNLALGQWQSRQLFVEPTQNGYIWIQDRWYRGRVGLLPQGSGMTAINYVNAEEYLYSVVGAEAIPSWPQEALKAQAVAARTYALYKKIKLKSPLYDLDATTKTQVYKGLDSEFLSTQQAVDATSEQILTYNSNLILAVFHSSSGGHTENVEDVWTSPLPYLRGVVDYDQEAPVFQWTKTLGTSQIGELLGVGHLKSMVPLATTPQGRVLRMRVVGDRASKQMTGEQIRSALGLRSSLFRVYEAEGNFYLYGRGYGHGVGLSQWGAYYLSTQGLDYRQILSHYYQRANLALVNQR
ncbi:MAG: SpoIID/LytB domain-containing protein [Chloroflexaceae bacterium]|nr:SpoIID/LytB domain-containing protein [Chloroflexaceae bacterium]